MLLQYCIHKLTLRNSKLLVLNKWFCFHGNTILIYLKISGNLTGVYLLDFFCSGIQFNLLLSPYPCFISLLYLDLYVLGDDALIS